MDVIRDYFVKGFSYSEIIGLLKHVHGIEISLSTLKRRLRQHGLKRRAVEGNRNSNQEIVQAIQQEMNGSGSILGYRRMQAAMMSRSIICRHEDVRLIIKSLNPEGVILRKKRRLHRRKYVSRGPNYAWHIDGHDKLKPFGFSIHGCIDGFSRKLIWLEVGSSNKLPEIVAKFYLDSIKELGGIPSQIKADDGTEHSLIEPIHVYLHSSTDSQNSLGSFSIISSPENQRIESYWSTLQRDRIGWWKSFFRDMTDQNVFTSSDLVLVDCIRFCFMPLIRKELQTVRDEWNSHIISKSRNSGPRGRPDVMYYLPHLYHSTDCLINVDADEIEQFYPCVTHNTVEDVSPEFKEFAQTLMQQNGWDFPNVVSDALRLYMYLLSKIEQYS